MAAYYKTNILIVIVLVHTFLDLRTEQVFTHIAYYSTTRKVSEVKNNEKYQRKFYCYI